jgi:hypothetical protein
MTSNLYASINDAAEKTTLDLTNRLRALLPYSSNPTYRNPLSSVYNGNIIGSYANTFTGSFVSYLFYISLFVFVLFILLIVIHYTVTPIFSFAPNQPGLFNVPTVSDVQTAYTTGPAPSELAANISSMCTKNYTVGFDLFLTGDFNISDGARVLLYKSKDKILSSAVTTMHPSQAAFPETDIIIWLDNIKNDLYVGTFTTDFSLKHTTPIENLPIRKPFRITVVFSDNFIEVYKDGKIEQTLMLTTPPLALTGNPPFYPPVKTVPAGAMLGNLSFWPRILSAREVRANGKAVATNTFFSPTASVKLFG